MAQVAAAAALQRAERRRRIEAQVNTGLFSTTDPEFAGLSEGLRRERELSRERARQNAFLKAMRLGKFGQRSLLSGSFAGITNEAAAAAALGGTRAGFTVGGGAPASRGSTSGSPGSGGAPGGGRAGRYLLP